MKEEICVGHLAMFATMRGSYNTALQRSPIVAHVAREERMYCDLGILKNRGSVEPG